MKELQLDPNEIAIKASVENDLAMLRCCFQAFAEGNMIHQDVQKFRRSKVTQKSNLTLTSKLFTSNKFSGDDLYLLTNKTSRTAF